MVYLLADGKPFLYAGAPTSSFDGANTAGIGVSFQVGDTLIDTSVSPNKEYFCRDNSTGAAVWTTLAPTSTETTALKATNLIGGNATTLLGSIPYQSNTDTTTLLSPNTTTTKKYFIQTGDGVNGAVPVWNGIAAGDVPTLNQNTTGSAGSLKSPATTGLMTVTGMAVGQTRAKTVRDSDDTIMEVGGSYNPTGTWNWVTGTPTVTWPTFNQNTTGTATNATNAVNTGITEDVATITQVFPTWVTANNGNLPQKTTSTKLMFTPSTGVLESTILKSTQATGTAPLTVASTTRVANLNAATCGNADTVTTNANLTGPVTSVGNATSMTYGSVTETASFSQTATTAGTAAVITTMTTTPAAGTYLVSFSCYVGAGTNGASINVGLYSPTGVGNLITHSNRRWLGQSNSTAPRSTMHTQAIITVNGAQAIEARAYGSAATGTIYERSMQWVRVA